MQNPLLGVNNTLSAHTNPTGKKALLDGTKGMTIIANPIITTSRSFRLSLVNSVAKYAIVITARMTGTIRISITVVTKWFTSGKDGFPIAQSIVNSCGSIKNHRFIAFTYE